MGATTINRYNTLYENMKRSFTVNNEGAQYSLGAFMRMKAHEASGETLEVKAGEGIRYVCPQSVDKSADSDVDLFFRTIVPARETTLVATCGGEVIARKKLAATTPGAMEKLTIPQDKIAGLCGEIVVSAEHKEVLA